MWLSDKVEWDYISGTGFLWVKQKSGKFRVYEAEEHQGTRGGGAVLNGTYTTAHNVLRNLDGDIMSFKTKEEAEAYAKTII